MGLGIEQIGAGGGAAEQVGHVDDARALLIDGEGRGGGGARIVTKAADIVAGDIGQHIGGRVIVPHLGRALVVTRIFLKDQRAIGGDGDVVEHHLTFGAVQQRGVFAALAGVCRVDKVKRPEPRG